MEFYCNGNIIFLDKNENENIDMFLKRGKFIIKNINNCSSFNELIKYSHIYIYYKYYNCIYNKTLMNKLKNNYITNL